jgi:hypothetical protein
MDMIKISNKEIQYNIMLALMQCAGSLSELVEQKEVCKYDVCGEECATIEVI